MAGPSRPAINVASPADVLRFEWERLTEWSTELESRAASLRAQLAGVGNDQADVAAAIVGVKAAIATLEGTPPAEDVPQGQHLDDDGAVSGHSRACGLLEHVHGPDCARDCPTCGGRP